MAWESASPLALTVAIASLLAAAAGWGAWAIAGRRWLRGLEAEALSAIALIAALHVAVSYTFRIAGAFLGMVLGPLAVFVSGIGGELLPALLLAVAVTLFPRPGTLLLSSLAVFLVNGLLSGQMGLVALLYVTISVVVGEACLALFGVTVGERFREARPRAETTHLLRLALALGIANMATLYAQFCVAQVLYRLFFASWYVALVSLVTGLLYGAAGAAAGTVLGYQLRRTAP